MTVHLFYRFAVMEYCPHAALLMISFFAASMENFWTGYPGLRNRAASRLEEIIESASLAGYL